MVPGSGDTVAIAWLGYDAPDHIPAAVLPGYALDGAPAMGLGMNVAVLP